MGVHHMNRAIGNPVLACAYAVVVGSLMACGGGRQADIGGAVSGLGAGLSLTLQNNQADKITVTRNGAFQFVTDLGRRDTYNVTVALQPTGQTCSVANGNGTVDYRGTSVNTVAVTCTTTSSVGGTVFGLPARTGVILGNAGTLLPVAANGAFAFSGILAPDSVYDVSVVTQPAGHLCSVLNPTGTVAANVMASVTITCN